MTEAEWEISESPQQMLDFLKGRASERKLRLFAVACCRQPTFFQSWRAENTAAVSTAERYAEGQADLDQLRQASREAWSMGPGWCCEEGGSTAARQWAASADRYAEWISSQRRPLQADLLREIFGQPWHPIRVEPAWRAWQGGTVAHLAQAAYEERQLPAGLLDNTRLAVLADAVEEAGCSDLLILKHLRSGREHIRGCFVLDAILGKS